LETRYRGKYRLYWASQPPPGEVSSVELGRLVPVDFSTEEDALHAAALILRAKEHVWCIERPDGSHITAQQVAAKTAPLLALFETALRRARDAR
jgi:hypothetical protein